MEAEFKVIKIDPEGSGLDYSGHLGLKITKAKRCCKNCTIIFGEDGGHEIGPFTRQELKPLNDAAKDIHNEIDSPRIQRW